MATSEVLRREIKVLAFDQYGTIVDMQKGLTEAVTPFLKRKGWDGKPNSFVTWWRRTHFENSMIDALCDRGHTPYREIGQRAVAYVMDRCGIGYTADQVAYLVGAIDKLSPLAFARVHRHGAAMTMATSERDLAVVRHDWTRGEVRALFELPFPELIFRAKRIHRLHFDPTEVQISTLISIKTGGCPEDCAYCPQSSRYQTSVKAEKLMRLDAVVAEARAAKNAGPSRFVIGAAS